MSSIARLGRFVRGLLLAIGISVFGIGLLVVFAPRTATYLPIETLGSDYVVVALLGIVAIVFALFAVLFRRLTGVNEAVTPVVEGVQSAPYPGASFDRSNERLFGIWMSNAARTRLREAAIQSIMRSERCSRSAAERRIEEGSWTDDTAVARLLGDGGSAGLFRGAFRVRNRGKRAVEAIEAIDSEETQGSTAGRRDDDSSVRNAGRSTEGEDMRTAGTDDRRTDTKRKTGRLKGN